MSKALELNAILRTLSPGLGPDVSGDFVAGRPEDPPSIDCDIAHTEVRLRVVRLLKSIEWTGCVNGQDYCPKCENREREGHLPDCELAAALKDLR